MKVTTHSTIKRTVTTAVKRTLKWALYLLALPVALWTGYLTIGWQVLPAEVPVTQQLADNTFGPAADRAMAALQQAQQQRQLPALTAAVVYRGQWIWGGAAGFADVERQVAVDLNSQFRLGSSSKPVTATAIARAVQQGTLALDTPIRQYHASLPNPAWANLTMRQLLSHTAGLPGYEQNTDWPGLWQSWVKQRHFSDVEQSLQLFDSADLLYPAGSSFHYSSYDVVLASSVLQQSMRRPFLQVLAEELSAPLQLTTLRGADAPFVSQVTFYQQRMDGAVKPHWPVDLSQRWAGGGLAASSADLARIGAAWLEPAFLNPALVQQFWTPQVLTDGRVNPQNYALGWRVSEQNFLSCDQANPLTGNIRYIHHGGVSSGAQSWLVVYPDYQLVLAMNTNTVKENFCDFAVAAADIARPFLQQLAPELFSHTDPVSPTNRTEP